MASRGLRPTMVVSFLSKGPPISLLNSPVKSWNLGNFLGHTVLYYVRLFNTRLLPSFLSVVDLWGPVKSSLQASGVPTCLSFSFLGLPLEKIVVSSRVLIGPLPIGLREMTS